MKSMVAALCLALGVCSCAPEILSVKQFTLRDQEIIYANDPMVQNEKHRRLYGAVSAKERNQRLGQYYTILWNDQKNASSRREIIFRYQQGMSGSSIKEMRRPLSVGETKGKLEITITGDNYFKNGRVLAWKIDLAANGKIIASKQSYLWE